MAAITLDKLNKHYGSLFHAVKDVDLEIADKEFVALVGPSGCGKSTTLRMIAGLEDISSGDIRIGDRIVNDLPPRDRDIAMVFQSYALYQHMTVYDNLAFGLRNRKLPETSIKSEIDRAAGILGLGELMHRRPKQLSGGQQQRVALGRGIARLARQPGDPRRAARTPRPRRGVGQQLRVTRRGHRAARLRDRARVDAGRPDGDGLSRRPHRRAAARPGRAPASRCGAIALL